MGSISNSMSIVTPKVTKASSIRSFFRNIPVKRLESSFLTIPSNARSFSHRFRTLSRRTLSLCCSIEKEANRLSTKAEIVSEGLGGTNLYLVGMMGSGKTTVGSVLAKRLNYMFMDSDEIIEQAAKQTIECIFQENGEDAFRELETSVLRDLHQYKNLVVSTGGGIVIKPENWSYLQQGIVIFLNGSPEKLAYRVAKHGLNKRPLLSKTGEENEINDVELAKEKLRRIYKEREDFYKNADIEVSLDDSMSETGLATVDEVIDRILIQLNVRMEDAKRKRKSRQRKIEFSGTFNLPDGRPTINTPPDDENPKGVGNENA